MSATEEKFLLAYFRANTLFNWRFRYNFAFTLPLKGKVVLSKTTFLFFNNEVHINSGRLSITFLIKIDFLLGWDINSLTA